jgi:DNA primase
MPNIFTEFTEKVRAANTIQDVMPELLPDFKGFDQAGVSRLKCLCPFHKGDDASLMVYLDDQSYRCLRCDRRGDVFDLVQGVTGADFIEAATILAERAGIEIPQAANADLQFDSQKRQIQDILVAAADLYWLNGMLLPTTSPKELAEKVRRGREQQDQAKYGKAEKVNLAQYLAAKGFDMELAKKSGVVTQEGTDFFQDRDITPVWARGRVVYMVGHARHHSNSPQHLDLPVNEFVKRVPFEGDPAGTWGKLLIALSPEDATTLQEWGYDVLRPARASASGWA